MTIRTNARVAGIAFLLYIVAGISAMAVASRPGAAQLLTAITSFCAVVLGVTLYAITRRVDEELALLAMLCRVIEAVPGKPSAIYFAVASTIFCWLLLRGRLIPAALAWLGLVSSAALVVLLLLQLAGLVRGVMNFSSPVTWAIWLPLLIFEIVFAVWLIVKGVSTPVGSA